MGFQYATPVITKPRKVRLVIPENLALWIEEEVTNNGGTFELVVSQALEFARASQAGPKSTPTRKGAPRHAKEV